MHMNNDKSLTIQQVAQATNRPGRMPPRLPLPGILSWLSVLALCLAMLPAWAGDPHVLVLGRVSDEERAARMRGCTVYCSPSVRGESFGMVLLEAMASGCALVASDLDGHRNVATDGVDALLTPVGDAAALAKALRRVIEDDDLRAELVAGGRRRADALSMTHLAERYADIYRDLLEEPADAR